MTGWRAEAAKTAAAFSREVQRLAGVTGREFRPYQADAAWKAFAGLQASNVLLTLPQGTGKTYVSQLVAYQELRSKPGSKVLVVVPAKELRQQYFDMAAWMGEHLTPRPRVITFDEATVPTAQAGRILADHADVIITTPLFFWNRVKDLTPATLKSISVCILDEVDLWSIDDFFQPEQVRLHQAIVDLVGYFVKRTRFLGLTASALSTSAQKILLERLGCKDLQPYHRSIVPHLPSTRITPIACYDHEIVSRDLQITEGSKELFGRLAKEVTMPLRPQDVWPFLHAVAAGKHGQDTAALARGILNAQRERIQLYEDTLIGSRLKMAAAERLALTKQPAIIFCREIQLVERLAERMKGVKPAIAHSKMGDQYIREIDAFKQGARRILLMTRDLGKRGVDFPMAKSLIVFSPKSSSRAMDQELCRTRSTIRGGEKEVFVLFYASTYEEEKLRNVLADLVSMRMYGRFDKFTLNARWAKWLGQRKAKTLRDLLLR